jgi:hypothetical protein
MQLVAGFLLSAIILLQSKLLAKRCLTVAAEERSQ